MPGNRSFERGRVRFQVAVSVEQPTARRDEPSERGQRRRGPAPDLSGADAHHPIRRLGPGPGSGIEQADAVVEASLGDQRPAAHEGDRVVVDPQAGQGRAALHRAEQQFAPAAAKVEHPPGSLELELVEQHRRVRI